MKVYAKRSLSGLIQLWATVVLPPVLILIGLIVLNFDLSQIDTSYIVIGVILLFASILYLVLFGKTMFLPSDVILGNHDALYIHTRKHHEVVLYDKDIVNILAIKNARMSFLRLMKTQRSYGKLIIKTVHKTYHLYPISNVDIVKNELDKRLKNRENE